MRLWVCWRSGEEPEIKRVSSGGASAPPFLEGGQTMNYTYIVQCSDGTLYTGWTNDLDKRIKAHNDGKGAKYTKPRLPVELVYAKGHATKEEAMKDEYRIKQLSRKRKQELCKEYEEEQRELQEEHPEQAVSSEEKSSGVLKDKDIREPLFEFLEETYGKVRILEEKTMGRSRADLVMVAPECLYGIEIKSDADTYARLKRQVKDYDQYYDYNIVVVGSTHAMHIEEHVPDYWGIVTVEQMNGKADFYFLRLPKENPKRKWERKMQILWRPELATIQEWLAMPKYKEKSKRFVVDKILECVPERIPEEILSRQISDILFERDYNTIAKTLTEYRKAERKKKGGASCRYRKRKRI